MPFWKHMPKSLSSESVLSDNSVVSSISASPSHSHNKSIGEALTGPLPIDTNRNSYNKSTLLRRPTLSTNSHSYLAMDAGKQYSTSVPSHVELKQSRDQFLKDVHGFNGKVFGTSLAESLKIANAEVIVQSELVSFGRIPIIVAKCGAYLKANALQTSGIFRIAGNTKRLKELQYIFSTPPDYGAKFNSWDTYTVHDVASLLRRFLNNLQEPLIPLSFYDKFRAPLQSRQEVVNYILSKETPVSSPIDATPVTSIANKPPETQLSQNGSGSSGNYNDNNDDIQQSKEIQKEVDEDLNAAAIKKKELKQKKRLAKEIKATIKEYEELFLSLPNDPRQLTIYLLDLLSLFSRQSKINLMSARNLSAIFQPSILSHPQHDMDPKEYEVSRLIVEFLIEYSYKLLPNLLKKIKETQNFNGVSKSDKVADSEKSALESKRTEPSRSGTRGAATLKVPEKTRPHSKSIGSATVPPDVIASSKRRSRLLNWIHKPDLLSDASMSEEEG